MTTVYTIGYGEMKFPEFSRLLDEHHIAVLVDIRTNTGKFHMKPGYSSAEIEPVRGPGRYRYDVRLGGKYKGPSPAPGRGGVESRHPEWKEALDELIAQAAQAPVAIICAEEDPAKCHRGMWVQPELEERGVEVIHIRQ